MYSESSVRESVSVNIPGCGASSVGLFFGEQAGVVFVVVLVPVDDDVFGGRNQTVLDAAEAADRLLIGSRMEEADILRIPRFELGQEDRVDVRFRVVESSLSQVRPPSSTRWYSLSQLLIASMM